MTAPQTSSPALTLRLKGTFSACDASGLEITGISRRGQALLSYLSQVPDMRAERARLADLLWSERSEAQARASLRQELSVLRRTLPEGVLSANRQLVWLDPTSVTPETSGPGTFLDGFDLPSEGFEDWLRAMRQADDQPSLAIATAAHPDRPRSRPSLAVLPFDEIGADDADVFADGVVEEITGALSRAHEFHVIARQSVFALRGTQLDALQIADKLGVDYLVAGSVRRLGDRVRISVQLVQGRDEHTIWAARFDDRLDDLFDLQDRVAAQVAGQIMPNLRTAEIARARTTPPEHRSAYELFLTALPHMWAQKRDENARALELFDRALAIDGDYAPAMSHKAWALAQQSSYMWSDDPVAMKSEALDLAHEAAERVVDHAPSMVAVGAAVDQASTHHAFARSFLDRALSIDPNNAWGWMRSGWNHHYAGEDDEANACFDRAEALSPLDPFLFNIEFGRGVICMREGRYEDSLAHFTRGMTLAPGIEWAYRFIASLNIRLGRETEAEAACKKLLKAYPGLTVRKLGASIPPSAIENHPDFVDALRRAGMPEG
jgi:TolB-like protein/Tfp pilus assembly protein PilF